MPRKVTKSLRRDIAPDRKYESVLVHKLINKTMLAGKKQTAEKIVYEAMEIAAKKLKHDDALKMLEEALGNVKPNLEVKSRRIGGANYQVPYEIKGDRQTHKTLMWFIEAVRGRRGGMGKSSAEAMAAEIVDAFNQTGNAVKKREDVHKMAEANRAFAHFAKF
jgi:small subunit ribosomal protein S7